MAAAEHLRILVVEDEMLVAFLIEDCLSKLGHKTVGPTPRVDEALKLLESENPDIALLDINLGGEWVYPVAELLVEKDIPFIFLSGYGERGLPAEWKESRVIEKPFSLENLRSGIESTFAGASSTPM